MKLYQLTSDAEALLALLQSDQADNDPTGEFSKAVCDTLDGLQGQIAEKLDACAAVAKTLQAEANAAEAKRLADRKRALENRADGIKAYMQSCMEQAGLEKSKGRLFAVSIQANPPAVQIADESLIPDRYVQTVRTPDKAAIRLVLTNGGEVSGASLVQSKSLRIR